MSWAYNPKNAQAYSSTRVNNNVIAGNCSYPNGTVIKVKCVHESDRQNNYFSSVTKSENYI